MLVDSGVMQRSRRYKVYKVENYFQARSRMLNN